jgi:hypothetical protein
MATEDKIIIDSFTKFVLNHKLVDQAELDALIDQTVAAYIINAIKNLYEEHENHTVWLDEASVSLADEFDLDSFVEIMDAYLNGFTSLPAATVLNWLVVLKKEIDVSKQAASSSSLKSEDVAAVSAANEATSSSSSLSSAGENEPGDSADENLKLLFDMFPDVVAKEVARVYAKSSKNPEKAIDELLMREDFVIIDDDNLSEKERQELKEKTLQRYICYSNQDID